MNKIIVQLKIDESTDFDSLIHVEDSLIQSFVDDPQVDVDGHDIGQYKFNIHIHLGDNWDAAIEKVTETLDGLGLLLRVVVAKYDGASNQYEIVRPDTYIGDFAL